MVVPITIFLVICSIGLSRGFKCYQCSGAKCFEANVPKVECDGYCFTENFNFMKDFKRGCRPNLEPRGLHYSCRGDLCNQYLPPQPPLFCYKCRLRPCTVVMPCYSPNMYMAQLCYTIFDAKNRRFTKGCIGELDYKSMSIENMLTMEVCDSNECNGKTKFLNQTVLRPDHKPSCTLKSDTEEYEDACTDKWNMFNDYCYVDMTNTNKEFKAGCLSKLPRELFHNEKNIAMYQYCIGAMCNTDIILNPTKCGSQFCNHPNDGCSLTAKSAEGSLCSSFNGTSQMCVSTDRCFYTPDPNVQSFTRICYVCSGRSCAVIRPKSTFYMAFCKEYTCFYDAETMTRGCGSFENAPTCEFDFCNSAPFGIYCYQCFRSNPNCALYNPDRFIVTLCKGVTQCFTTSYEGQYRTMERGCGKGTDPNSQVCNTNLCNFKPVLEANCDRYRNIPGNTTGATFQSRVNHWYLPSCPRVYGVPLCYVLVDNGMYSGGCSSEKLDILELLATKHLFNHRELYFCDENDCNLR